MKRLVIVALSVGLVGMAAVASAQTLRVIADRTNVRDKASTDGAIVVAVSKGDELDALDKAGTWYHVRVRSTGEQGFVSALVVEPVHPATPAASSPAAATPLSAPTTPAPTTPLAPTPPPAAATQQPGPRSTAPAPSPVTSLLSADRNYSIRVFGGLWSGFSTTGFGGGAGFAFRPFSLRELELEIDGGFARQSLGNGYAYPYAGGSYGVSSTSLNLIQGSGNVLYNIKLNQSFTVFAGGGLEYSHESASSPATVTVPGIGVIPVAGGSYGFNGLGFQGIGGIEKPIGEKRAVRVELRAGNGLLMLGGLSF
jgi:opacity protein-like surface antigen